ncbi:MAG TPA: DUF1761 domain-containing protein [Candidatus Saccharimonadales bacterium]|nr:DUF1761 domain-containing protein [Candidatus Saccharimonadales bacterium]
MLSTLAHSLYSGDIYGPAVSVSWLGIILAVAAAMVIGSIWYGPLFGKRWMQLVKLSKKDVGNPVGPMLVMVVLAFVQVLILAHFINYVGYFYPDYSELATGVLTGLWAFVGFVVPVLVSNAVFAKGSMELLKMNLGNQLVTLLAIGAILGTVN